MLKKALLYALFATLALVLTAVVALYLVVKLALAPGPDEWPARLQFGPLAVDVGVPTALRLATSTWFAPWLDGHRFESRFGPVLMHWDEPGSALELRCAPCAFSLPALGSAPLTLASLRGTVRRDAGSLSGVLEATPEAPGAGAEDKVLRARWNGRLTQKSLQIDINAPDAPIAQWYALLVPQLPELRHAHITGKLALNAQLTLPGGSYSLQPRISDFAVDGLATGATAGARNACGAPSRLTSESWLARAAVAAQDPRFFIHSGYEPAQLMAALGLDPKATQAEREGSTLGEQLAGQLAPAGRNEPGTERLRRLLYSVEMEETLGKTRILQLYLDNAPWGNGVCGAEAAAKQYFRRAARNLEPAQAVWMAALLHDPAAAIAEWQHDGRIDASRIKPIAEGMRGISKPQRDALQRSLELARFAPP